MGGGNLHALVAHCRGYVMQKPGPVTAIHFDHGVGVGRVIIYHHTRRHGHGAEPGWFTLQLADLILEAKSPGK